MVLIRIAAGLMVEEKPLCPGEYTSRYVVDLDKVEAKETPLFYNFGQGNRVRKRDMGVVKQTSNVFSSIGFEIYIVEGESVEQAQAQVLHLLELEVMDRLQKAEMMRMTMRSKPITRTQRIFLEKKGSY